MGQMSELRGLLERVKNRKATPGSVEVQVREAARDLSHHIGVGGPPVDLKAFLSARSILQTQKVAMKEDGILYALDESRLAVDLKGSNSEARDRFTCAHEIGHTFFIDRESEHWFRSLRISDGEVERPAESNSFEERFCNIFAGELLLPTDYLRPKLFRSHISWRSIFEVRDETKNSLTSCAVRSVQASLSRVLLISWQPFNVDSRGADFRANWQMSSPAVKTRAEVTAPLERNALLFKVLTSQTRDSIIVGQLELPLRSGGSSSYYSESISIDKRAGTVLTLCVLEPRADVYGSLAPRWARGNREQLELFP
jgi:hypothetical protein